MVDQPAQSQTTAEDHNEKWRREAKELAASLVAPVADEISTGLLLRTEIPAIAKGVVRTVLAGLIPRFRQEAAWAAGADEMAYREAMGHLNLIEVMAGVNETRNVDDE